MHNIFPWQQEQWLYLLHRIQQRSIPQGLLLTGSPHIGKLIFAKALAEYMLCQQPNISACSDCRSCKWIEAGSHPNLILLRPELEGKIIKIDQIRELIEDVSRTVQQSDYKIIIMEPAEAMNIAAANALLKTLEEPPAHIIFILISHQLTSLPATIRSRCQIIKFPMPEHKLAKAWLSEQTTAVDQVDTLLKLAENAPLKALALAENNYFEKQNKIKIDLLKIMTQQLDPVQAAQTYMNHDPLELLHIFHTLLMDIITLQSQCDSEFLLNQHFIQELQAIQSSFTKTSLLNFMEKILAVKKNIQNKVNLNVQLLLENLFVGITTCS